MKTVYDIVKDRKEVPFHKGDVLFREGERCKKLAVRKDGEIVISSFDHNGNEVVYNTIRPGMMFGNNLLFSTDPHYRGNVNAVSDGSVIYIGKEEIIELMQKDRELLLAYLEEQSDFGKRLNSRIKLLSFDKAEDRLYYDLHSRGGSFTFSSVSAYAGELGIKRETLSRLLSVLCEQKRLKRRGNTISLIERKED